MDVHRLYYFLTVAELGNITQAADKLHVTQPALSKAIKRLEDELGAPLFERHGNRITLNECGRVFRNYTERSLQAEEIIRQRLKVIQEKRRDSVLLGYTFPPGEPVWLHEGIRQFVMENPDVALSSTQLDTTMVSEYLRSGRVSLAVSAKPFPSPDIVWHETCADPLGILLPTTHPLVRKEKVWLRDLKGERIYCPDRTTEMGALLREHCRRVGFEPDVVYEGPHTNIMNESAWNGNGVIYMSGPFYTVERHNLDNTYIKPRMIYRKLWDSFCVRPSGIAMLRDAELSPPTQRLLNILWQHASQHKQYLDFIEDGPVREQDF